MCHLNLCFKKWGSPSSFRRKGPFISLNSSAFIENLLSSECACACVRANPARNGAQKGCVMQLNGITLNDLYFLKCAISTHNFLKSEWIHSRKTAIRPKMAKSSIFSNVCQHKRQHFELLVPEIKCRYSTVDLCTQIYANMLISSRCPRLIAQFAQ